MITMYCLLRILFTALVQRTCVIRENYCGPGNSLHLGVITHVSVRPHSRSTHLLRYVSIQNPKSKIQNRLRLCRAMQYTVQNIP